MSFFKENFLYILFFGVAAFMMFRRGGCCGNHSHTGDKNDDQRKD